MLSNQKILNSNFNAYTNIFTMLTGIPAQVAVIEFTTQLAQPIKNKTDTTNQCK